MHLAAYSKAGPTANHPGAWRHPESALGGIFAPERYEHIARVLEGACDGFIIWPTAFPPMFKDFRNPVGPELRHGLFRREYAGRTLRENLALP
jgi:hypothetical protein